MKKRFIVIGIVILGVGFAVGFFVCRRTMDLTKEFIVMHKIVQEGEDANNAYLTQEPKVAIYALKHYINVLEYLDNIFNNQPSEVRHNFILEKNMLLYDMSLAHVRLGFLYEKTNDLKSANAFFTKGLSIYKSTGKEEIALDELKNIVKSMDSAEKERDVNTKK